MIALPDRIISFLKQHHIFHLSTCCDNKPWAATCFYAFDEKEAIFYFTSEKETRHGLEMTDNTDVAVSIALETRLVGKIRGVQMEGIVHLLDGEDKRKARRRYLKRFPHVAPFLGDTPFWIFKASHIKLTDNRLGFGKKLVWGRE